MEKATKQQSQKDSGFKEDLDILRQASLLRGLDHECLKLLAMLCQRIKYTKGDQLMVQGEDAEHAYCVISGQLSAIHTENESTHTIRQYGAGQFVGGCNLLGRIPHLFTLQAVEKTTTLRLSREQFNKVLEQFPSSLSRVTANLVSELANWDRSLLDIKSTGKTLDDNPLGVSLL
ncbi:MAG: cyclic nucleotide-binding domain-containing protein [Desulfocapsa sp.]|nr:cyclic nucleotide-binding domain-containing protein [Desulfocapsa sp.]